MSQLEDIHKILLDQNRELGYIRAKVESIEEQAKKTNGRVTALETSETNQQVNWARVSLVGSMGLFLLIAAFNFIIDYIKAKLFPH